MAYDFFTQPRGPTVPINLFPDAATAGINAGNAQKTTTQAIAEGVVGAVETYQGIKQNSQQIELNEAKLDQVPLQQELLEAQVENAETISDINQLKLETEQANKDLELEVERYKLQVEKQDAKQKATDIETQFLIDDYASKGDFKGALTDPRTQGYLSRKEKSGVLESILGGAAAAGQLTEEEKKAGYERLDFSKAQEAKATLELKQKELEAAARKKLDTEIDKDRDILIGEFGSSIADIPDRELPNRTRMVPSGSVEFNEDGTVKPGQVVPKDPAQSDYYDFIVDGKVRAYRVQRGDPSVKSYNKIINNLKTGYPAYYKTNKKENSPDEPVTQDFVNEKAAEAKKPPRTVEQLVSDLQTRGLNPKTTEAFLDATQDKTMDSNIFKKMIEYIAPSIVSESYLFDSTDDLPGASGTLDREQEADYIKDLRTDVKTTAAKLASEKMNVLRTGSPEQKQALRGWAEAAQVSLTPSALNSYYRRLLSDALEAATLDVEEGVRSLRDTNNIKKNSANALKGMTNKELAKQTPDEVLSGLDDPKKKLPGRLPKQAAGVIASTAMVAAMQGVPTIAEKAKMVVSAMGGGAEKVAEHIEIANKVNSNKLLKNEPVYVKAISAVENAGRNFGVSRTGVVGPMQVTGLVARSYGLNKYDPEENVLAGRLYIEDLIKQFRGNRMLAYAAYNAGPATIRRAVKNAGSTDWKDVKKHLFEALKYYEKVIKVPAEKKIVEAMNYPEKVMAYEEVLG